MKHDFITDEKLIDSVLSTLNDVLKNVSLEKDFNEILVKYYGDKVSFKQRDDILFVIHSIMHLIDEDEQ